MFETNFSNLLLKIFVLNTVDCQKTDCFNVQTLLCLCVCVCADEEEEELHGKLEDDRFLFSLENDSAACDVLDLREVLSVFVKDG